MELQSGTKNLPNNIKMSGLEWNYLYLRLPGTDSDLLVRPELVRQLRQMIMVGHLQLKICYSVLFHPILFCLRVGLWPGQTRGAPELQQCHSSTGAGGIWLLAAVLTSALHRSCSISLHLFPSRTQQDEKWWQVTRWLFACGRAPSHIACLHGQLWDDMLYTAGRGQSAAASLASLQTAPTPWCSLSLTAEQNEGYFWFIAATCNELYLGGLLIWSTLARVYCLSATDGKTNSINGGNPFIVSWIQHPPESTTKPLSVSLNTTFYI